jgi:hypothetical protein
MYAPMIEMKEMHEEQKELHRSGVNAADICC